MLAAVSSESSPIPPLSGLIKNHKPEPTVGEGHPLRPVAKAREAPNSRLGMLVAAYMEILLDIESEETGTEVKSTEEVCARLRVLNKRRMDVLEACLLDGNVAKNVCLCSMDVKSLYPSLDIDKCAECAKRLVMRAEVKTHIDSGQLALFLGIVMSDE